jgi:hypothetical protein
VRRARLTPLKLSAVLSAAQVIVSNPPITVAALPDLPNRFAGASGGSSTGGTPAADTPSRFIGSVKPANYVEGVGSGDDEGVWRSDVDDTDDEEMTATATTRTTPSRSAKGKGKTIVIDDDSNDDMEDDDDGDSDEHGDNWLKKASVQELEERAEKADPDQANEYERKGLDDDDDDSDREKEGKEDYVPDGGEKQVDYAIAIATYGRSETFEEKTYPLLVKHGLTAKATLFLQSPEDEAAYARFGLKIVRREPEGTRADEQLLHPLLRQGCECCVCS